MTGRSLLDLDGVSPSDLEAILGLAEAAPVPVLDGRGVALIFEKPSARTRNATEMAVVQLGGHPVSLRGEEVGIDLRETAEDVARTLACYHAAICARVFDHGRLERMAAVVDVPVVNLLSDRSHPCQAVADLLTLRHHFGHLDGLTVAYVGDWNNVARSLGQALALSGANFRLGCPSGYGPTDHDIDALALLGPRPQVHHRVEDAVRDADAVYTDVWTSMGAEERSAERRRDFQGWTVTPALMAVAGRDAVFLHCLPAHRGEEVSSEVLEGRSSLVWPQARNRLLAARGVLRWLMDGEAA